MEQKKILYMGIDLTDEQAMVSLFGRGMEEPETMPERADPATAAFAAPPPCFPPGISMR